MAFNQSIECDDGDARDAHSYPFTLKKKKREGEYTPSPLWHRRRGDGSRWASPSSQAARYTVFNADLCGPIVGKYNPDLLSSEYGFRCRCAAVFSPSKTRRNGLGNCSNISCTTPLGYSVNPVSPQNALTAQVNNCVEPSRDFFWFHLENILEVTK